MSLRLSNGEYLAKGESVTGFANVEEDYADNAVWTMNLLARHQHVMPWRIEDELKKIGANYMQAGLWRGFALRDGNLVTGQQKFLAARDRGRARACARRIARWKPVGSSPRGTRSGSVRGCGQSGD